MPRSLLRNNFKFSPPIKAIILALVFMLLLSISPVSAATINVSGSVVVAKCWTLDKGVARIPLIMSPATPPQSIGEGERIYWIYGLATGLARYHRLE